MTLVKRSALALRTPYSVSLYPPPSGWVDCIDSLTQEINFMAGYHCMIIMIEFDDPHDLFF